jgi:hypothetical protein
MNKNFLMGYSESQNYVRLREIKLAKVCFENKLEINEQRNVTLILKVKKNGTFRSR